MFPGNKSGTFTSANCHNRPKMKCLEAKLPKLCKCTFGNPKQFYCCFSTHLNNLQCFERSSTVTNTAKLMFALINLIATLSTVVLLFMGSELKCPVPLTAIVLHKATPGETCGSGLSCRCSQRKYESNGESKATQKYEIQAPTPCR